MKKLIPLITILFFSSCEKEPFESLNSISSEENKTDNEQKVAVLPPVPVEKIEIRTPEISTPVTPSVLIQEVKEIEAETKPMMPQFSDELLKAVGNRAAEVLPQIASKSSDAKALYNEIVGIRESMLDWSTYAEGTYLEARKSAQMKKI